MVMLLQLPQNLFDFLVRLLGLPGCTGAALGGLGQFSGPVAQLLPDPLQRLSGLPQFLVKHALPLSVGSFTGPADSDRAQFVLACRPVGEPGIRASLS
jgi:hypothetical protein